MGFLGVRGWSADAGGAVFRHAGIDRPQYPSSSPLKFAPQVRPSSSPLKFTTQVHHSSSPLTLSGIPRTQCLQIGYPCEARLRVRRGRLGGHHHVEQSGLTLRQRG